MSPHRSVVLVSAICLATLACQAPDPQKAEQQAAEAQREADSKQAKAFAEYEHSAAQAQNQAADKAGVALNALVAAQKGLDVASEEKIGKSEKRISDLRAKIATEPNLKQRRSEMEKKIDAVTVKLARARSTLSDARTANDATEFAGVRARLESELAAIDTELATLEKHV